MSDARKVRAAQLRAEGLTLRQIGEQLGVSIGTVRRDLDPDVERRDREQALAWKNANRERKRAYDREYSATHERVCPSCGGPMHRESRGRECLECRRLREGRAAAEFVAMWNDGLTIPEIAATLGRSRGYVTGMLHRYRSMGYDLPYRYRTFAGRPLVAKNDEAA